MSITDYLGIFLANEKHNKMKNIIKLLLFIGFSLAPTIIDLNKIDDSNAYEKVLFARDVINTGVGLASLLDVCNKRKK